MGMSKMTKWINELRKKLSKTALGLEDTLLYPLHSHLGFAPLYGRLCIVVYYKRRLVSWLIIPLTFLTQ